ncbi:hypothetical protein SDC9_127695 [bioreactor metagenome]|uniref:Uncharacterized protein n=1 Tax=bioreactor metagenome TaxID=1076179 RepID=A0A645CUT5_9ZZZZ
MYGAASMFLYTAIERVSEKHSIAPEMNIENTIDADSTRLTMYSMCFFFFSALLSAISGTRSPESELNNDAGYNSTGSASP